jgi:hypothetical protein
MNENQINEKTAKLQHAAELIGRASGRKTEIVRADGGEVIHMWDEDGFEWNCMVDPDIWTGALQGTLIWPELYETVTDESPYGGDLFEKTFGDTLKASTHYFVTENGTFAGPDVRDWFEDLGNNELLMLGAGLRLYLDEDGAVIKAILKSVDSTLLGTVK